MGVWSAPDGGDRTLEFRADGSVIGVNVSADERCNRDWDAKLFEACGKKARWERTSRGVDLTVGFISYNGPSGSLQGLFDAPKDGPACRCEEDHVTLDVTGTTLAVPGTRERLVKR